MTDQKTDLPWSRDCQKCGADIGSIVVKRGRVPIYCSARCRMAAMRARRRLKLQLPKAKK